MIKVTVLYGQPANADAFEAYYTTTHGPIANRMKGVERWELTRFQPGADGARPAFYRMAELYFPDAAQMQATLASPEGQAAVADIANFATGGATMLVGEVV